VKAKTRKKANIADIQSRPGHEDGGLLGALRMKKFPDPMMSPSTSAWMDYLDVARMLGCM
jgi:hypothetical protein